MQITEKEVDSIEDIGMLHKNPVKMIRTKGGFWIAVGKQKGKYKDEALAAGSHPAVVKFNLEKQYPDFQPSLMKSENFADNSVVESHSHFLSDDLRKSGHDLYSIQNGNAVEFQITKHNTKIASVNSSVESEAFVVNKLPAGFKKEFAHSLASAVVEKAVSCNKKKIVSEK
jgi:hypothetical protein